MKEVSEESLLGWTPKLFYFSKPMQIKALPMLFPRIPNYIPTYFRLSLRSERRNDAEKKLENVGKRIGMSAFKD